MKIKTKKWLAKSKNQEAFHLACQEADEVLYGGAAGGGKTDALMREAARQIDNPKYRAILFRRTFPEVESSFIDKAYQWYEPAGLKPKDRGKVWYKEGGGQIRFAHLQYERDVHKHQSAEYTVIGFDELTSFTEFQYKYMMSRLRTPDITLQKYIMSATNPGNVGHGWVKRKFIEPAPENTFFDDAHGMRHIFIPAQVYDNPVLMQKDPDYVKRLESLAENDRKALLEGNWDVFEGQYFIEWSRPIHVLKPFKLDARYKRFICFDYGYYAPSAVYWGAIDFWGRVIFYREIYETKLTYENLGRKIAELTGDEKIEWIVIPRDLYKASEETGVKGVDIFKKGLYSIVDNRRALQRARLLPANTQRVEGWTIYRDFLKPTVAPDGGKTAGVVFFNVCTNAIRTIPELIHDEKNVEDVNSDGEDHAGDGTRYGLVSIKMPKSTQDAPDEEQQRIDELNKEWKARKRKKARQRQRALVRRLKRIT